MRSLLIAAAFGLGLTAACAQAQDSSYEFETKVIQLPAGPSSFVGVAASAPPPFVSGSAVISRDFPRLETRTRVTSPSAKP